LALKLTWGELVGVLTQLNDKDDVSIAKKICRTAIKEQTNKQTN